MAQDNLESLAFDLTADIQGDCAMILRSRIANAVPDPRQRGIQKKAGEQTEPCFKSIGEPRLPLSAALQVSVSLLINRRFQIILSHPNRFYP